MTTVPFGTRQPAQQVAGACGRRHCRGGRVGPGSKCASDPWHKRPPRQARLTTQPLSRNRVVRRPYPAPCTHNAPRCLVVSCQLATATVWTGSAVLTVSPLLVWAECGARTAPRLAAEGCSRRALSLTRPSSIESSIASRVRCSLRRLARRRPAARDAVATAGTAFRNEG